ncbi:MAG: cobalt ABC transporter permease [Desulfomonilaceae bacterium]
MKKPVIALVLITVFVIGAALLAHHKNEWEGVDDSVVKKFAEQAGRPPREPYINIAQGDMELFFFLIAGLVGGFTAGYYFRELFPPTRKMVGNSTNV